MADAGRAANRSIWIDKFRRLLLLYANRPGLLRWEIRIVIWVCLLAGARAAQIFEMENYARDLLSLAQTDKRGFDCVTVSTNCIVKAA